MKLESGNNYTISQIFSGDNNKIIIPDLQRDYCWGNEDNNLVKGFIESLLELDKSQTITMGLLYGYYNKYTPEHLQLCDGQQRLTTIFLIIGVINRKLGYSRFANLLMSSFELNNDDQEPYLQYAIRDSSLYFLSDLTVHYFLQNDIQCIDEISRQPWYLNDYILDPTVKSIISAIGTIENVIMKLDDDKCEELGKFIETKLNFLFYDMENRENGEETFVVINTTGEPLTATQNLKPLVIKQNSNSTDVAKLWEEMETWFWRNRRRRDTEYPHTSNEGMYCFLNIVRLLHCNSEEESYNAIENYEQFPYKEIAFEEIYDDFTVYKKLSEMDFSERFDRTIKYPPKQAFYQQDRLYSIIPTMAYCLQFNDASDEEIKRIYHLFSNMAKYRDTNRYKDNRTEKLYSPVYRATSMVKEMLSKDCLSLLNILVDNIKENVEEPVKLKLIAAYKDSPEERKETELLLAEAESNSIFNGQVANLVEWSLLNKDSFRHYYKAFTKRWIIDDSAHMDLLRRALLTYELDDYPLMITPSFANLGNKDTWLHIIQMNSKEICQFLDESRSLQEMIDNYNNEDNKWYAFIKNSSLIQFAEYKNTYVYGSVIIDMKKERTSSDYKVVYKSSVYDKKLLGDRWFAIWAKHDCIWCDNCKFNLTIDCFIRSNGYQIVVWRGKNSHLGDYPYYDQIGSLGLTRIETGDWADRWITEIISDANLTKQRYIEIANQIDKMILLT